MSAPERAGELAANLTALRARIDAAARAAGRAPGDVTLVAVSKTFPATDVAHLLDLGVTDFGENRDQEAASKAAQISRLAPGHLVRWHFVGQIQRNKALSVASYADVVHSVDRVELADALGRAAARTGRRLGALVQVNLDELDGRGPDAAGEARGGVRPRNVVALAEHVAATTGLRLAGVMALGPLGGDPGAAFARLAVLAEGVRGVAADAVAISAGMSADLETAIGHGATYVRVGAALFGDRALMSDHVR